MLKEKFTSEKKKEEKKKNINKLKTYLNGRTTTNRQNSSRGTDR